jgi:hypothetical protein
MPAHPEWLNVEYVGEGGQLSNHRLVLWIGPESKTV